MQTAIAKEPSAGPDLADLAAVELLEAYGKRRLSPIEVMRVVLERVERCEPTLHALYAPDLNVYIFHSANDSADDGTIWAYRYHR